jgi:hypothetical protein
VAEPASRQVFHHCKVCQFFCVNRSRTHLINMLGRLLVSEAVRCGKPALQTLGLQAGSGAGGIYERLWAACQTLPTLTPSERAIAGHEAP